MHDPTPDVVLGQGALGTLLGASLAGGERPVHVVSRRVDEPREVTLSFSGRRGEVEGTVELRPEPPDEARLILVATRSDQAVERAQEAAPAVIDDGAIVPLQNGLTPLAVADALDESRVAPTVVGFNAQMTGPRSAEITSPGHLTAGPMAPEAEAGVEALAEALEGRLTVRRTDNPRGAVWSKWCVSCAINGLAVVAGHGVGEMTRRREGREALVSIVTECVELAKARGVESERVAGPFKPDTLAGNATSGLGGAFRRGVVWLIGRRYSDVTPSSIDALRDGRDPEIDALNLRAVQLGDEVGIPTPWNRATLELAEELLAGKREPALEHLEAVKQRALGH